MFQHRIESYQWQPFEHLIDDVRNYLQVVNHRLGTVFTPVDPVSHQRGDEYTHHHAGRVWYLPTGAENRIFRSLYINSEWNPTP
jgi:hypothetical protein